MTNFVHEIADTIREDTRGGVSAHVYSLENGAIAGALGGLAMVAVAIIYGLVSGNGIWYPVNLIAAVVIRQWQSAPATQFMQFDPLGLVAGITIHLVLSVTIGLLFTLLLPTLPGHPLVWAFLVGPLLWFGALLGVLPLINPVMVRYLDMPSFFAAHVVYSLVAGWWLE